MKASMSLWASSESPNNAAMEFPSPSGISGGRRMVGANTIARFRESILVTVCADSSVWTHE
jgi:hypothetical protein